MFNAAMLVTLLCLGLLYWFPVRRWFRRWGASGVDLERPMSGDRDVPNPTSAATLAVTIAARPEHVWPWLVQIGDGRGGLYSYDWLDRLFGYLHRPSAERILPEHQRLDAGDVVPLGRGPGFPVKAVEPYRTLLLGGETDGFRWTWEFGLYPLGERRTRLVSRNRVHLPPAIGSALMMRVLEPAAFVMTRKMLLGLRRRAEALSAQGDVHRGHAA
jgi:hypothetical protein